MTREKSLKMDEDYNPNPASPSKFSNLDTSSDDDIERTDTKEIRLDNN